MSNPLDQPRPAVSVVMAVYNAGDFLAEAVESVLEQTFGDFEFVIVDDGSTDGSAAKLAAYAAADRRVRVLTQANAGLVASLNRGIEQSRAVLIARMDADDVCRPDRLARQVRFMEEHPEVVLLGGGYELIDGAGRALRAFEPPADDGSLQRLCLAGLTPISHPLAMFRRDAALSVGGYDPAYATAEDLDLWLRLGEVGRLACLPGVILGYRMHAKSMSETQQDLQINNRRGACEAAWGRRGIEGRFEGAGGWRADAGKIGRHRQLVKFGWWAFRSGHRRTAAVYGLKAVAARPGRLEGWKLLAAAAARPNRAPLDPGPPSLPPPATPARQGVARHTAAARTANSYSSAA